MKFSGKVCFKIILKVTRNQGSTLSIEDREGGWGWGQFEHPPSPRYIRVKMPLIKNLSDGFLITYYPSRTIFKDQKFPLNSIFDKSNWKIVISLRNLP